MPLSDIEIFYGESPDAEPRDSIKVINNESGDINKGFKGKYVWLVPKYDTDIPVADIRIIIETEEVSGYQDLAKGSGGEYRYLDLRKAPEGYITDVALLRQSDEVTHQEVVALGYQEYTEDINKGRKGDYLYLLWKVTD